MLFYTNCIKNIDINSKENYYFIVTRYKPDNFQNKGRNYFWMPNLSPSAKLLNMWKRSMISWEEFERKYTIEVSENFETIQKIINIIKSKDKIKFHLCCYENKPILCHRSILACLMIKIDNSLECVEWDLRDCSIKQEVMKY